MAHIDLSLHGRHCCYPTSAQQPGCRCCSPSMKRLRFFKDMRGMQSLLMTTLVQNGFMAWARLGVISPPGGQKAQHLTSGYLSFSFRAIKAAAPAPRLCPARHEAAPYLRVDQGGGGTREGGQGEEPEGALNHDVQTRASSGSGLLNFCPCVTDNSKGRKKSLEHRIRRGREKGSLGKVSLEDSLTHMSISMNANVRPILQPPRLEGTY